MHIGSSGPHRVNYTQPEALICLWDTSKCVHLMLQHKWCRIQSSKGAYQLLVFQWKFMYLHASNACHVWYCSPAVSYSSHKILLNFDKLYWDPQRQSTIYNVCAIQWVITLPMGKVLAQIVAWWVPLFHLITELVPLSISHKLLQKWS